MPSAPLPVSPVRTVSVPAVFQGRLRPLYPLYRSFTLWSAADGLRMSAAMSFYGVLSLAPLLVFIISALAWWLDRAALEASVIAQIRDLVGAQGADVVQAAIHSASQPAEGVLASLLAFGVLLMGATGVFAELQAALERLWLQGTGAQAGGAWWRTATLRLRGVGYVLAFGFLMLVSLLISSLLGLLEHWAGRWMPYQWVLAVLNQTVSWLITTALFVALMRLSAGPKPALRHLLGGAAVGAVLFGVGKYALAVYLSTAAVVSAYGAAGSLVVLLMWIYFASAVLLYGASCARVLAEQRGQQAMPPMPDTAPDAASGETVRAQTDTHAALHGQEASARATLASATPAVASPAHRPDPLGPWRGPADMLALAATFGAAFWLTRRHRTRASASGAPAAQAAATPANRLTRATRALRAMPRPTPAAARAPSRATSRAQALRLGLTLLAGALSRWRERHALRQASRTLAHDVQALQAAARRRRHK